jgi:hypothetical protein
MIQVAQEVTGSILQEQIPAEYLVCSPPVLSQCIYGPNNTGQIKRSNSTTEKKENVTMSSALTTILGCDRFLSIFTSSSSSLTCA